MTRAQHVVRGREFQQRVAVRLDRLEAEIALAVEREERDEGEHEQREQRDPGARAAGAGRRRRGRRAQLRAPCSPKSRWIHRFDEGVRPSLSRWSATRRLICASVG